MELSPAVARRIQIDENQEFLENQENLGSMLIMSPSKGGVAFDVDIKSQKKTNVLTPAKARLEGYGDARSPSSTKKPVSSQDSGARRLRSQELVEKAKERNEKAREVGERVRVQLEEIAEAKRRGHEEQLEAAKERREAHIASVVQRSAAIGTSKLEQWQQVKQQLDDAVTAKQQQLGDKVEKASEKHREALQEISTKAGKHFEDVKTKSQTVVQQRTESSAALLRHITENFAHKEAAHDASVAGRGEKASQHNEVVMRKFEQHRTNIQKREQELLAKQQQDLAQKGAAHDANVAQRVERASQHNDAVSKKFEQHRTDVQKREQELLAKHQQKRGSKIDGRPHVSNGVATKKSQPRPQSTSRWLANWLVCGRC